MLRENNQYNILFESEIKALKGLDKDLANKSLEILEKALEYKRENENVILELERVSLKLQEMDVKSFNFWYGFGMVSFFIIVIFALFLGGFLSLKGFETSGLFSFIIAVLMLLPRLMQIFKNAKNSK